MKNGIATSTSRQQQAQSIQIEFDNEKHCPAFVQLNECWIKEHFMIEEADRYLAADPYRVVREGGHILAILEDGLVIGVCALFKKSPTHIELARMAVDPNRRGKGFGDILIKAAIAKAREDGAKKLSLVSNTILLPAITLYRKHGFKTLIEGQHPFYARGNIVMELCL